MRRVMSERPPMSRKTKAYIALVIASGALLLVLAAGSWSSANLKQFVIFLGLAALASALKVRIPGMESTISPNFVFLLLAMVALPFSHVAAISLVAALVQSLWASAKRPRLLQVAFSAAALVLSSSLAYKFAHLVLWGSGSESPVVCVFPYFMVGIAFAGLVSGVYTPSAVWKGALVLLPTMVLTYAYFLNRTHRALPAMMLPAPSEEEYPVEVHS